MCAALASKNKVIRPGKAAAIWRKHGKDQLIWAGFARREALKWWKDKGCELVDVPASRFAERSDRTRLLAWDDLPPGLVVRGLVDPHEGHPILKIVTRASTPEELQRFEHPRMPLLEEPLFSADLIELAEPPSGAQQMELF
jgi:hypothetical protein